MLGVVFCNGAAEVQNCEISPDIFGLLARATKVGDDAKIVATSFETVPSKVRFS